MKVGSVLCGFVLFVVGLILMGMTANFIRETDVPPGWELRDLIATDTSPPEFANCMGTRDSDCTITGQQSANSWAENRRGLDGNNLSNFYAVIFFLVFSCLMITTGLAAFIDGAAGKIGRDPVVALIWTTFAFGWIAFGMSCFLISQTSVGCANTYRDPSTNVYIDPDYGAIIAQAPLGPDYVEYQASRPPSCQCEISASYRNDLLEGTALPPTEGDFRCRAGDFAAAVFAFNIIGMLLVIVFVLVLTCGGAEEAKGGATV